MMFRHFALWPHLTVLGDVADTIVFMAGRCIREVATPHAFFTAPRTDRAAGFILRGSSMPEGRDRLHRDRARL